MNCTFKKVAIYTIASSLLLLSPKIASAISVEEVVNPQQSNGTWVTDMADILNNSTETKLNQIINKLEQKNGTEIAVVTVDNTSPAVTSKAFATELFNYWSIGKAETNNGVLFLISVGDRRVEIETGLGIEPILSDIEVQEIIDRKITPQFKKQNFDRGTLNGTQAIINALDNSVETDRGWTIFLIVIGSSLSGITVWIYKRSNKIFVDPAKTKLSLSRNDNRIIYCAKCSQPMARVEDIELSYPQKIASKIGSTSFKGYKCATCSESTNSNLLVSYLATSSRYENCPRCREATVIFTQETIEVATYNKKGKLLTKRKCQCCDYAKEITSYIPRLHRHDRTSTNNYSNSSSSYYSDSSCSGGGSSGSSFGGGSSDGGGAGGDW